MLYDVVVIGGGPSGSSAARRCSQLGMKVLLIDKAKFPREKLCGGAVSEQALSYLGFELPPAMIEREIYGARVHFGKLSMEVRKPYRIAVLASRSVFDDYLLSQARASGCTVLDGTAVKALEVLDNHVEITTASGVYHGRVVIGCDGFNSVVARYVRRPHRKDEYAIGVEASIPAGEPQIKAYIDSAVDVHFNVVDKGYGWVFPHREYFLVGVGGVASEMENPKNVMDDFLESTGFARGTKTKGFPIPAGGIKRNLISDRLLLAGDSAGFVDAFTGEGIAYAIRSGQIAGEAATLAVKSGDCSKSALNSYLALCKKELLDELGYALLLSRVMHRYPDYFIKLLASEKEVLENYLDVPARRTTYREYLWWLVARSPVLLARSMSRRFRTVQLDV